MIDNFSPENLRPLRTEIEAALAEVAQRNGITLSLGKMNYDPVTATFRAPLDGKAGGAEAAAKAQAVAYAKAFCGVDATEPSTHPARKGATLLEHRSRSRSKPWAFSWKGQVYITDNAGLKAMFPKVAIEDLGLKSA